MVDSVGELQDLKRFSEGHLNGSGFSGWHDYGEQQIEWGDIIHLYILSLQKTGDDSVNPQLVFTLKDSPTVHLISGKHFKYKTLLGEKFTREHSSEECFKVLVEKFVHSSSMAYIDISVKDFLSGGASFVPKVKNLREILRYRITVEKRSHEEPLYKEEEKDQKIRLRVWEPGAVIDGQYKVLRVFKGGMGVVYIVSELDSSTLYAVKMFQEQYLWDKQIAEMFSHEAQVWIELEKHKNIVQALFVKTFQGCPALFLEYVDGSDLEQELRQGALDIELSLDFALQFCAGMNYAYEKLGIVHSDIKPSNCLLDKDWILKITDFGLVKIFSEKEEGKGKTASLQKEANPHLQRGTILGGTLAYMAPEAFSGDEPTDTRSDIYSFGVMFYEMLTGKKPIPGRDMMDYMKNHSEYSPIPPRKLNSLIPADLSTLVLHCLAKKPSNRFRNFRELQEAILLVFREYTGSDYVTDKTDSMMTSEEWTNKALSLAALGRHEEALKPFDTALEKAPKDAFLWYKKGDSYVALNRLKMPCFPR